MTTWRYIWQKRDFKVVLAPYDEKESNIHAPVLVLLKPDAKKW